MQFMRVDFHNIMINFHKNNHNDDRIVSEITPQLLLHNSTSLETVVLRHQSLTSMHFGTWSGMEIFTKIWEFGEVVERLVITHIFIDPT